MAHGARGDVSIRSGSCRSRRRRNDPVAAAMEDVRRDREADRERTVMTDARQFIRGLHEEVQHHGAIHHNSFLEMVASRPFSKKAWLAFGQQLYPHVHFFIPYMEAMLLSTFDMTAKLIVSKILLDEYGEDAGGKSHPELFRRFVKACGGSEADAALMSTTLDPATSSLVETHMRICQDEPFLVSIGAIGEAHEYAIAHLFPPLVKGMQLAGFT